MPKKRVASKKAGGITKEMLKQLGGALATEAGLPADLGSMLAEKGAGMIGLKKGGKVRAKGRGGYARGGNVYDNVLPTPVHHHIGYDPSQMYARGGSVVPQPGGLMMRGGKLVKARGIGGSIGGLLGNFLLPGVGGMLGQMGGDALGGVFGFAHGGRVGRKLSHHTAF